MEGVMPSLDARTPCLKRSHPCREFDPHVSSVPKALPGNHIWEGPKIRGTCLVSNVSKIL